MTALVRRIAVVLFPACVACGDVTSDLITREWSDGGSPDVTVPDAIVPDGNGGAQGTGGAESTGGSGVEDAQVDRMPPPNAECTPQADECLEQNRERPYCDEETFRCVECLYDGHCREADEKCSAVLGLCAMPCTDDAPCLGEGEICDTAAGFCVECRIDDDCEPGELCRGSECQGGNME